MEYLPVKSTTIQIDFKSITEESTEEHTDVDGTVTLGMYYFFPDEKFLPTVRKILSWKGWANVMVLTFMVFQYPLQFVNRVNTYLLHLYPFTLNKVTQPALNSAARVYVRDVPCGILAVTPASAELRSGPDASAGNCYAQRRGCMEAKGDSFQGQ